LLFIIISGHAQTSQPSCFRQLSTKAVTRLDLS
jgi:hypothetical protein